MAKKLAQVPYNILTTPRRLPTPPQTTLRERQERRLRPGSFSHYAQHYRIWRPIAGLQRPRSGHGLPSIMLAEAQQPPTAPPRRHEQAQPQSSPFQPARLPLLAPRPTPHSAPESVRFHAAQPPQSGVNAQRLGPVSRPMLAQTLDNQHLAHAAEFNYVPRAPRWTRQKVMVLSREWWAGRHWNDIVREVKKVNESRSEMAIQTHGYKMRKFVPTSGPESALCRLPYLQYKYL